MSQIDVILPTYNQQEFLHRAINAILGQEFKDFQLIIVDDGSTDDTPRILKGYTELGLPNLRIISYRNNGGLPHALNYGHGFGTAPYCTWV